MSSSNNQGRRDFLNLLGISTAVALVPWLEGCGSDADDDSPVEPNAEWERIAAEKEATGVYTAQQPGEWVGKEATHLPKLTFDMTAKTVTVTVGHPMTAEHWITAVYIRNEDDVVIGLKEFLGTDLEATATFSFPASTTKITAY